MNNPHDPDVMKFKSLYESTGLTQHVHLPTRTAGHTLDIVLTCESEQIAQMNAHDDLISDHSAAISTRCEPLIESECCWI